MPKIGIGNWSGFNSGISVPNGSPSALILTVDSDTAITGAFTIGSTNQDGHYVYISTDNGVTYAQTEVVWNTTSNFTKTGLTENTIYYFKVAAYKGSKLSEYSNTANETTQISQVYNFIAPLIDTDGVDETYAHITWTPSNKYELELFRNLDNAGFSLLTTLGLNISEYNDQLFDGNEHTVQYYARFKQDLTVLNPPINLDYTVDNGDAILTWDDNNLEAEYIDIWADNGLGYAFVASVIAGVQTYRYSTYLSNINFKLIAREGTLPVYSNFSEELNATGLGLGYDPTTRIGFRVNIASNPSTLTISGALGFPNTVTINWGDGSPDEVFNYLKPIANHTYSVINPNTLVTITGNVNKIQGLIINDSKVFGDISQWYRYFNTPDYGIKIANCLVTGDLSSWNFTFKGDNNWSLSSKNWGLHGDLSNCLFHSTCYKFDITNRGFTDFPRGSYQNMGQFGFGLFAAGNNVSTVKLNAWLSWLKTFWDSNTPTQNCIYTLTGANMGYPTGGNSNADIVAIKAKYTAAGKTATFNINT
jgi:hypothetical protein